MKINKDVSMSCPNCGSEPRRSDIEGHIAYDMKCPKCGETMKLSLNDGYGVCLIEKKASKYNGKESV